MSDYVLLLLSIPLVTAFVGWSTNMAAVKMIFYPIEFKGIGPLGWQGILPRNSENFAMGVAQTLTGHLLTANDLIDQIDLQKVGAWADEKFGPQLEPLARQVADELKPGSWDELPDHVKQMVLVQVRSQGATIAKETFQKVRHELVELLDLHHLVVSQLSGDGKERLVRLFKEISWRELRFIEYYGALFGFLIGLVQVAAWQVFQTWWLMPIVGVIVGLVTNYLAIQMIFRPQEPTTYLGVFRYQGLFPSRQAQIAHDYGRQTGDEILSPKNLIGLVTEGERGQRLRDSIRRIVSERLDKQWAMIKPMVPVEVDDAKRAELKEKMFHDVEQRFDEFRPDLEQYLGEQLGIRKSVEDKLSKMPKAEFERILRGLFEKDETTLIIIGGVLGGLVGLLQGFLIRGF